MDAMHFNHRSRENRSARNVHGRYYLHKLLEFARAIFTVPFDEYTYVLRYEHTYGAAQLFTAGIYFRNGV